MAFLKGAGWGLVVGGLTAAITSLIAPQPAGRTPPAAPQVDAPGTASAPRVEAEGAPVAPATDSAGGGMAQGPDMPAPAAAGDAPVAVTETADAPPVTVLDDGLDAPAPDTGTQVAPGPEAPVLPNPQSMAPRVPTDESDVEIQTDPPAPVVVETPDTAEIVVIETVPVVPSDESPDVVASGAPELDAGTASETDPTAERPAPSGAAVSGPQTSDAPRVPSDARDIAAGPNAEASTRVRIDTPVRGSAARTADARVAPPDAAAPSERADESTTTDTPDGMSSSASRSDLANPSPVRQEAEGEGEVEENPDAPMSFDAPDVAAGDTPDPMTAPVEGGADADRPADTASDEAPSSVVVDQPEPMPAPRSSTANEDEGPRFDSSSDAASDTTPADMSERDTAPDSETPRPPRAAAPEQTVVIVPPETPTVVTRPAERSAPQTSGTQADPQTGVIVRRPALDSTREDEAASQVTTVEPEDPPAIEAYAAFHDGAMGLPLMSVVLIDDGSLPDGPRALADIPFAVTVALDPAAPDAGARMQAYRDEGFEVAALAKLPEGGTAQDVAVALEGTFTALPETVALVAAQGARLGRSDPATERVARVLAEEGRGLLALEDGLNGALGVARGTGVPALPIYRDLREVEQNARTLRRFVDQAAFRAGQQDGVVVIADLTPDVLSALILWGTANRAEQVSLAPLSATLQAEGH
ncbi:divergent polysaccharide deacetylase family protein [Salipiger sp. IMCC34102]|uniref:divergent polysaccharide deacetylase family protein n=1 Tax=Salipiger sp. IMCC34102 TaxID=2510647 RepID=UPI0013ED43CF|nr:divergent polysaccharide deacetylase family protein [Salipiger sp. IMCC34102]